MACRLGRRDPGEAATRWLDKASGLLVLQAPVSVADRHVLATTGGLAND
jgi:hypothetical protein